MKSFQKSTTATSLILEKPPPCLGPSRFPAGSGPNSRGHSRPSSPRPPPPRLSSISLSSTWRDASQHLSVPIWAVESLTLWVLV